jgi:hypothetical protein
MQARMFDGGNNFNEKLVELVGKHRFLYDNTSEGYTNFQVQDEIWRKIATELREDGKNKSCLDDLFTMCFSCCV